MTSTWRPESSTQVHFPSSVTQPALEQRPGGEVLVKANLDNDGNTCQDRQNGTVQAERQNEIGPIGRLLSDLWKPKVHYVYSGPQTE